MGLLVLETGVTRSKQYCITLVFSLSIFVKPSGSRKCCELCYEILDGISGSISSKGNEYWNNLALPHFCKMFWYAHKPPTTEAAKLLKNFWFFFVLLFFFFCFQFLSVYQNTVAPTSVRNDLILVTPKWLYQLFCQFFIDIQRHFVRAHSDTLSPTKSFPPTPLSVTFFSPNLHRFPEKCF